MQSGDKVLYDSRTGYEIGVYRKEISLDYVSIQLESGSSKGLIKVVSKYGVYAYTERRQFILKKKYGYDKSF